MFLPHLFYSISVWSYCGIVNCKRIQILFNKAIGNSCKIPNHVSIKQKIRELSLLSFKDIMEFKAGQFGFSQYQIFSHSNTFISRRQNMSKNKNLPAVYCSKQIRKSFVSLNQNLEYSPSMYIKQIRRLTISFKEIQIYLLSIDEYSEFIFY